LSVGGSNPEITTLIHVTKRVQNLVIFHRDVYRTKANVCRARSNKIWY
jgi:hypothetical protein